MSNNPNAFQAINETREYLEKSGQRDKIELFNKELLSSHDDFEATEICRKYYPDLQNRQDYTQPIFNVKGDESNQNDIDMKIINKYQNNTNDIGICFFIYIVFNVVQLYFFLVLTSKAPVGVPIFLFIASAIIAGISASKAFSCPACGKSAGSFKQGTKKYCPNCGIQLSLD